jgi:homoserine O-succinyltransferase
MNMPILLPQNHPAYDVLKEKNVFVMNGERGSSQHIRPLKIGLLNLMPTLEVTETQIIKMLANTPLQVDLNLIMMDTDYRKKEDLSHLNQFYHHYNEIKDDKFDGMIITGAPLEMIDFEEVDYWAELAELMDNTKKNVFSTIHICWGAQAGLYHHYGIQKRMLDNKLFGIFPHKLNNKDYSSPLTRGFDDRFYVPHSRHTQPDIDAVRKIDELEVLDESYFAGPHMVATKNKRWIFLNGHWEYDRGTLMREYNRDVEAGKKITIPYNYFVADDPKYGVEITWKGHANLFYSNWLNFVYQETPYDLDELDKMEW